MHQRRHPERDVQAVGLDPSKAPADVPQHHPSRYVGPRLAIDATRKHAPRYFTTAARHLDLVASRWKDYGIEDRMSLRVMIGV